MKRETASEWRCECFSDLLHRILEQELFVFNPRTGHTHILNHLSWLLLAACADRPRSSDYLYALMNAETEGANPQTQASLERHLEQLQQLDLLHKQLTVDS